MEARVADVQVPSLEVRRTIRAPRTTVFDAWTTPDELKRWHAPGPLHVELAELDVRVGGAYRIHMVTPDGRTQAYTWHRALSNLYVADGLA